MLLMSLRLLLRLLLRLSLWFRPPRRLLGLLLVLLLLVLARLGSLPCSLWFPTPRMADVVGTRTWRP